MAMLTIVDSIALRLLNESAVITGVGNELHVHLTATGLKLSGHSSSPYVLPFRLREKIHGIVVGTGLNADKLLIYGGREFMLIQWKAKVFEFTQLYRTCFKDWISAVQFLEDSSSFVLLTAHSVLFRFEYTLNLTTTSAVCEITNKIYCIEKSTLYCGHIHGTNWKQLVIFGGNAFGELLVWQPTVFNGNDEVALLHQISAHNGVIFSIDYDQQFGLLITTSDDRSIRFWNVTHQSENWLNSKLAPTVSGYGHEARVFRGKIIHNENNPYAVTVGEDSCFCIWNRNGELQYKQQHQFGAIIWNVEFDASTKTLFTVGSTGNFLAYPLQNVFNDMRKIPRTLLLNAKNDTEYVAKVKFLSKCLLIGLTNRNQLLYTQLTEESDQDAKPKWQEIIDFAGYKCTVLEVYGNLIALCGIKKVTLFRCDLENAKFEKIADVNILTGTIRSFLFLNAENFVISDDLGNCVLIRDAHMLQQYPLELPKGKERWLTAALMFNDFLLLSNRQGNLLLYKLDVYTNCYILRDVLKHAHGNLGATVLEFVAIVANEVLVKSAGHDGSLKLHSINTSSALIKKCCREAIPISWTDAIVKMESLEIFLGFNDNNFVAWSKQNGFTVKLPCGGGHRYWSYCIFPGKTNTWWIQLVFVRKKSLLVYKLKLFNEMKTNILLPRKNTWHVKACNAMCLLKSNPLRKLVLFSAGEDNLIKIATYCRNQHENLVQHAEVHSHISNIKALKVLAINTEECLIFSGGGRAQLCITKLNLKSFWITEIANYTLNNAINNVADGKLAYNVDPETRIMAIDVLPLDAGKGFQIFLGCSDGFVRRLLFNNDANITIEKVHFYGRCVLQMRLMPNAVVLAAGTDGFLKFYDLSLNEIVLEIIHHRSGINALDVHADHASGILHILSGGDDQGVTYSQLSIQEQSTMVHLKTVYLPNQHTAQVTAACLAKNEPSGALYAYTSGIDQNLVVFDLSAERVKEIFHSCVADIKGLCLDEDQTCFLYGCGLQVHRFKP